MLHLFVEIINFAQIKLPEYICLMLSECLKTIFSTVIISAALLPVPSMLVARSCPYSMISEVISENMFGCFVEDADDNVWIATADGLYRYDGSKVISYHAASDNQHTLQLDSISALYVNHDGRVLVGTAAGLQVFRPLTDDFSPVALFESDGSAVKDVTGIIERQNGEIWISGSTSCCVRFGKGGVPVLYPNVFTGKVDEAETIVEDNAGRIWTNNAGTSLFRLEPNGQITHMLQDGADLPFTAMTIGADGMLYVGGSLRGLYRYDFRADRFVLVSDDCNGSFMIRDLQHLDERYLLLNTEESGLLVYDYRTELVTPLCTDAAYFTTEAMNLTGVRVVDVYADGKRVLDKSRKEYSDASLMIEMGTLPIRLTRQATYSYALDGDRWITLPSGHNLVAFDRLSSGRHTFRYKAEIGGQTTEIEAFQFRIAVPFWQDWGIWSIISVVFAAMAVVIALLIRRIHSMNDIPENTEADEPQTADSRKTADSDGTDVTDSATSSAPANRRKLIVVADSDESMRKPLVQEFQSQYQVMEFADGIEAFEKIIHHVPDMIICDTRLDGIDGFELCRRVRQNIRVNHVPVILLSVVESDELHIKSLELGADVFMLKPFSMKLLTRTVQNLILGRERLRNAYNGMQMPVDQVETPQSKSPDERLMERVIKVVSQNLNNPDLTSEMIASEVGMSRVHLYRKLKELTNQSARNYIRNIRLAKAAELLAQKKVSVAEVADQVGFTNSSNFATAFKELYGVTPTAYMEEHIRKDEE